MLPFETNQQQEENAIQHILFETQELEYSAFEERDVELISGRTNNDRKNLLYYPAARAYQEGLDHLFQQVLPSQFTKTEALFDPPQVRWAHTVELALKIQEELDLGSPEQGGLVDCRAKSTFGIWEKLSRFQLDPNEIFDVPGVRITVKNHGSARNVSSELLKTHSLMEPHIFRRNPNITHQSLVDILNSPKTNHFASIRITLLDGKLQPYEVQIQTLDDYKKWRRQEKDIFASLAASPKHGMFVEPE